MATGAKNSMEPGLLSLTIPPDIVQTMLQHLRDWLPNEGCGLLSGTINEAGVGSALHFFPGTNVLHSPTRYRMADQEVILAIRAIRESGQRLLAIVHSHPRTAPHPSPTDLAELHYPEAAMLIVSFADAVPGLQAWRTLPAVHAIPLYAPT